MPQKSDAQLKIETDNVIKVNGNREITPPKDNALRTNIIDSKINKEGGNVVTGLLGYATDLTPTDDKHIVPKKYVDTADQALLPLDGSRAMLGALNMGQYNITEAIRILPVSGETITIGGGLGDTVTLDGTNVKLPNLTALQVLELDANNNIISVAKTSPASTATTGTAIKFDIPRTYGVTTPETGNITLDSTGAKSGMVQLIRHNHSSEPTFGSEFKVIGGSYTTGVINYIYCEYVKSDEILVTINQEL